MVCAGYRVSWCLLRLHSAYKTSTAVAIVALRKGIWFQGEVSGLTQFRITVKWLQRSFLLSTNVINNPTTKTIGNPPHIFLLELLCRL